MKLIFGKPAENKDYQVRKGAYAVILNSSKNNVLTVYNKGYHFLPGGGIEGNESNITCIEREMIEETGYRAIIGSFIGTAQFYFVSSKDEYLLSDGYFYLVELGEKIQEPIEEDHRMEWVTIDDMERYFFYKHQIWAVQKAIEK